MILYLCIVYKNDGVWAFEWFYLIMHCRCNKLDLDVWNSLLGTYNLLHYLAFFSEKDDTKKFSHRKGLAFKIQCTAPAIYFVNNISHP